jgi:hypothetical protein
MLGLFLTQDLHSGIVLEDHPGVVLPLKQHAKSQKLRRAPQSEGCIRRSSDNQFIIDQTDQDGMLQELCTGGNPSTPLSVFLFLTIFSFATPSGWHC